MDSLTVEIVRRKSTDFGTPSSLTVIVPDSGLSIFSCDALELGWRNNAKGISCIIADTYNASRVYSDHFHRQLWRLEDKWGRSACELHNGNFAGDVAKGLETQIHGCTLLGKSYGELARSDDLSLKQFGICNSKITLLEFMRITEVTDRLVVVYSWAEGCEPEQMTKGGSNE